MKKMKPYLITKLVLTLIVFSIQIPNSSYADTVASLTSGFDQIVQMYDQAQEIPSLDELKVWRAGRCFQRWMGPDRPVGGLLASFEMSFDGNGPGVPPYTVSKSLILEATQKPDYFETHPRSDFEKSVKDEFQNGWSRISAPSVNTESRSVQFTIQGQRWSFRKNGAYIVSKLEASGWEKPAAVCYFFQEIQ